MPILNVNTTCKEYETGTNREKEVRLQSEQIRGFFNVQVAASDFPLLNRRHDFVHLVEREQFGDSRGLCSVMDEKKPRDGILEGGARLNTQSAFFNVSLSQ